MRLSINASFLLAFAPAFSWAGEVVLLGCKDGSYQQEFWVGSGKQLRGQGLEFRALYCPSEQVMRGYTVAGNPEAFNKLQELAAKPEPDSMLLATYFDGTDPDAASFKTMFPEARELTFADVRGSLGSVARPLTEKLDGSVLVAYSHPQCDAPLIPADYYVQTGKPFPLCQANGSLKHIMRADPDPVWD